MSNKNDITKTRKCQHLTEPERNAIQRLLEQNVSKKQIARLLCRNISTIRREIKRGSVVQRTQKRYISKRIDDLGYTEKQVYFAQSGQARYEMNRARGGRKSGLFLCRDFIEFAEDKILNEKWSPDAAVGYAKKNRLFEKVPSTVTLYSWIDRRFLKVKNINLLFKCRLKPSKTHPKDRKRIFGTSIDERPESIDNREDFGHWEGDSVVGAKGESSVLTFVERRTNHAVVLKTNGKTAGATYAALLKLKAKLGESFNKVFKSITFDNGSEFASFDALRSLGIKVYYAHPYSAWERGQNENFNGMLRRFVPKGADFSFLSQDDLDRITFSLNALPRKKFGYSSALDLFNRSLSDIMSL